MHNYGATFNTDRQPVLPFGDLLSQKKIEPIALLPIGSKIKSFKIEHFNSVDSANVQAVNQKIKIKLPNFADLQSYSLNVDSQEMVTKSLDLTLLDQSNLRSMKRFWWHWLLSSSQKISFLVLLILFQSSSQASNLLERAKIYIDLDSHEAVTLPTSSKIYLNHSQASPFNRAITEARKIEVNSPFYPEAREDINRWSKTILDIAQGRADQGDLAGAIAAAELIPQNYSSTELIAQEATKAVKNWQQTGQKDLYPDYLVQAKTLINPNQASSYNQAIGILQQIAPGAKEYREAQHLISRWNEQIYLITKNRAAEGNFQQAVEAAILVSPTSIYHQLAKDVIEIKIKSIYAQYLQ